MLPSMGPMPPPAPPAVRPRVAAGCVCNGVGAGRVRLWADVGRSAPVEPLGVPVPAGVVNRSIRRSAGGVRLLAADGLRARGRVVMHVAPALEVLFTPKMSSPAVRSSAGAVDGRAGEYSTLGGEMRFFLP